MDLVQKVGGISPVVHPLHFLFVGKMVKFFWGFWLRLDLVHPNVFFFKYFPYSILFSEEKKLLLLWIGLAN